MALRGRLRVAVATTLAAAAMTVTVGWVVEREDTGHFEATASGVLRDLGGVPEGRQVARAILESRAVAEELRRNETFLADPGALSQGIRVRVSGASVRVTARAGNGEYAALLANRWLDAANALLDRALAAEPSDAARLLGPVAPRQAARRRDAVMERERRHAETATRVAVTRLLGGQVAVDIGGPGVRLFRAPDLVAVTELAEAPPERVKPSYARFFAWLVAGCGGGLALWLVVAGCGVAMRRLRPEGWA